MESVGVLGWQIVSGQTAGGLRAQHKQRACVLLNPTRPQRLVRLLTKTQETGRLCVLACVCVFKYVCVHVCVTVFV